MHQPGAETLPHATPHRNAEHYAARHPAQRPLSLAAVSKCEDGEEGAGLSGTGALHSARNRNPHDTGRYDGVTRVLHWLFAAGIIYASVVGYALGHITTPATHQFLSHLNMSLATVLIVLFPWRVWRKFTRIEPPPLAGVSSLQNRLAHAVHGMLYLLILAVLVSGFLMVPHGYAAFGVPIRTPFERGPLTDALFVVHRICCAVLASLVLLHVAAVVKHQWLARRNVLGRML